VERVYHTWEKWECYPAGFYCPKPPRKDMTTDDCKAAYAAFLRDIPRFETAMKRVVSTWPFSCEHYLTNERMNRIAWMGQAAMCAETGVSKFFCGGYFLLSDDEKRAADETALRGINWWLAANGYPEIATLEEAASKTQADLY
jgi:hypothetical protein